MMNSGRTRGSKGPGAPKGQTSICCPESFWTTKVVRNPTCIGLKALRAVKTRKRGAHAERRHTHKRRNRIIVGLHMPEKPMRGVPA